MPTTIEELLAYLNKHGVTEDYIAVYPKEHCPIEDYVAIKPIGDKWRVQAIWRDQILEEGIFSEADACKEVLELYEI